MNGTPEVVPAPFHSKATIADNQDGTVTVEWKFDDVRKFCALAKQATHVMRTPSEVFDVLYTELLIDAEKKKLFVNPADPHVRAHHAKHGEATSMQFFAGPSFFKSTFDKHYTHLIFSLFGAPGAIAALELQANALPRKANEPPEEKAARISEGIVEMLRQLEARRQAQPGDAQWVAAEEDLAEDGEGAVRVKVEEEEAAGVPPMPEGAVVKEEY